MTKLYIGRCENGIFELDADSLTRHVVVLGATGAGKTVLCKAIVEELSLRGYPILAIDPKGDIGCLALVSENFYFRPWSDIEAKEKGVDPEAYSKELQALYMRKLKAWNIPLEKVKDYISNIEVVIYTPRSNIGIPLSIKPCLDPPPNFKELYTANPTLIYDLLSNITSILLQFLKKRDDVIEQTYIAEIIKYFWLNGESIDLDSLIESVLKPPFDKIGSLSIEDFIPERRRIKLARELNALLTHPAYKTLFSGEKIDFDKYFMQKGRISVIDLRFLGTLQEKQLFLGILLQELYRWLLRKGGTSKLRFILYFDELLGFIPPTGNPPSKTSLLLLVKQARAFGLGCILATQNPVDIDYRILSNASHRFIGRLSTKQDIMKVKKGLNLEANLYEIIPKLKTGTFLYHNYETGTTEIVKVRWLITYHRGPLTPDEIKLLTSRIAHKYLQDKHEPKHSIIKKPNEIGKIGGSLHEESSKCKVERDPRPRTYKVIGSLDKILTLLNTMEKNNPKIHEAKIILKPQYLLKVEVTLEYLKNKRNIVRHFIYDPERHKINIVKASELNIEEFNPENIKYRIEESKSNKINIAKTVREILNNMRITAYYITPEKKIIIPDGEAYRRKIEEYKQNIIVRFQREKAQLETELRIKLRELEAERESLTSKLKILEADYKYQKYKVSKLAEIREHLKKRNLKTKKITIELRKEIRKLKELESEIEYIKLKLKSLQEEASKIVEYYSEKIKSVKEKYRKELNTLITKVELNPIISTIKATRIYIPEAIVKVRYGGRTYNVKIHANGLIEVGRCHICKTFIVIAWSENFNIRDYICPICGKITCKKDMTQCEICGRYVCTHDVRVCSICGRTVCMEDNGVCHICRRSICKMHMLRCSICGETICPRHAHTCSRCGRVVCFNCTIWRGILFLKKPYCQNCAFKSNKGKIRLQA